MNKNFTFLDQMNNNILQVDKTRELKRALIIIALLTIIFGFSAINGYSQCASIYGTNQTLCGAGTVTFTATTQGSGYAGVVHKWYTAQTGGSPFYTVTAAEIYQGAGVFQSTQEEYLTATKSYWVSSYFSGCESSRIEVKGTIDYSLVPTITPSILPPPTTVCTNTTFYFTSSSASSYDWRYNTTDVVGTTTLSTSQSYTPTQTGYYWVRTINGSCGAQTSVSYYVTLETPLSPNVTISGGGGSYCPGSGRTLTAQPTGVSATPSYVWKHGTTTISTISTASVTIDQTKTITLTMTSNDNCVNNTTATASTTISMLPYPSQGNLQGPSTICDAQSAPFVVYGSQSGYNYYLYRNGAEVASLEGTGSDSPPAGFSGQTIAGTYTLKGANDSCPANKIDMTGSIALSILDPTIGSISTHSQNPTSVCTGDGFYLTAETNLSRTIYSVQWKKNGVAISGATSIDFTPIDIGTFTYKAEMSVNNGCGVPIAQSPEIIVTLNNLPTNPNSPIITPNCGSSNLAINNEPAGVTFYWQSANDLNLKEVNHLPGSGVRDSIVVTGNPTLYLRALSSAGCWSSGITSVQAISLTVAPTSVTPTSGNLCYGESLHLTASGTDIDTYEWFDENDKLIGLGEEFTSDEFIENTTITLRTVNINNCKVSIVIPITVLPPEAHKPQQPYFVKNSTASYTIHKNNVDDGSYTYYWQTDPEGESELDNASSKNLSNQDHGLYILRPKSSNGCWGRASSIILPNLTSYAYAQPLTEQNTNYIGTYTYLDSAVLQTETDPAKLMVSTTYVDGLGRGIQSVMEKATPLEKDLVTVSDYDESGRKIRQLLPFASVESNGVIKSQPIDSLFGFYSTQGTGIATSEYPLQYQEIEGSVLGRVLRSHSPGEEWAGNAGTSQEKSVEVYQLVNSSELVKKFEINPDNTLTVLSSSYPQGSLQINKTIDENDKAIYEFTDKRGNTILKRVENDTVDLDTYYIYDDFNNLRFVIPPQGVIEIDVSGISLLGTIGEGVRIIDADETVNLYNNESYIINPGNTLTLTDGFHFTSSAGESFRAYISTSNDTFLDKWAFRYLYDEKQRLVAKRVPGSDWVYMVYDKWDRLVFTQDGEQRLDTVWLFTKYDALNRPILTGSTTITGDRDTIQTQVESETVRFEELNGSIHGYTSNAYPTGITESDILTVTYYDNYDFSLSFSYAFDTTQAYESKFDRVKGLVTGTKIRILDTPDYIESVNYYDHKYRVVQTQTKNQFGGMDKISFNYDFIGNLLESYFQHENPTSIDSVTYIHESFDYDHTGRLLTADHGIAHDTGGFTMVRMVENSYNELGELIKKDLHEDQGQHLQSIDYAYNIRGWLTNINDPAAADSAHVFGMNLSYTTGTTPQYNGNISGMEWNGLGEPGIKNFDYTYDPVNRITSADYSDQDLNTAYDFDATGFSYDANGNILGLTRDGIIDDLATYNVMDGLSYTYDGNRLQSVEDSHAGTFGSQFLDGVSIAEEYSYDNNGNMVTDDNKGITGITYNYLNLPSKVEFDANNYIQYIYDASGVKLRQEVYENDTLIKSTGYIAGMIYEDDQLSLVQTSEGRLVNTSTTGAPAWDYQYAMKDHLGNVRAMVHTPVAYPAYLATMEKTAHATESLFFDNLDYNQLEPRTGADGGAPGTDVYKTNEDNRIGPGILVPVYPGDKVDMSVYAYYEGGSGFTSTTALTQSALEQLLNQATTSIELLKSTADIAQEIVQSGLVGYGGVDNVPSAYLNYLMFDQYMNVIANQSGFLGVTTASDMVPALLQLPQPYTVSYAGYMLIYLSNESNSTSSSNTVWWDDLTVQHTETPVVQRDDYYPFGLTFNGWQRMGVDENKYLFNGKELQDDLDLDWYDYGARMYDATIGRFMVQDSFSEKYLSLNPYQYTANNPILFVDINGDSIRIAKGKKELTYTINSDGSSSVLNAKGEVYNGKKNKKGQYKGYVGKVKRALDKVRTGGNSGNGLVSALHDNVQDVTIKRGGNEFTAEGSDRTIFWSPSDGSGGLDVTGSTKRPSFIGLGHELGHAYDALDGQVEVGYWYNKIPNAEKFGSHIENTLRSENGIPLRQWYGAEGQGRILQGDSNTSAYQYYGSKFLKTKFMGGVTRNISIKLPFSYGTHKLKY